MRRKPLFWFILVVLLVAAIFTLPLKYTLLLAVIAILIFIGIKTPVLQPILIVAALLIAVIGLSALAGSDYQHKTPMTTVHPENNSECYDTLQLMGAVGELNCNKASKDDLTKVVDAHVIKWTDPKTNKEVNFTNTLVNALTHNWRSDQPKLDYQAFKNAWDTYQGEYAEFTREKYQAEANSAVSNGERLIISLIVFTALITALLAVLSSLIKIDLSKFGAILSTLMHYALADWGASIPMMGIIPISNAAFNEVFWRGVSYSIFIALFARGILIFLNLILKGIESSEAKLANFVSYMIIIIIGMLGQFVSLSLVQSGATIIYIVNNYNITIVQAYTFFVLGLFSVQAVNLVIPPSIRDIFT